MKNNILEISIDSRYKDAYDRMVKIINIHMEMNEESDKTIVFNKLISNPVLPSVMAELMIINNKNEKTIINVNLLPKEYLKDTKQFMYLDEISSCLVKTYK